MQRCLQGHVMVRMLLAVALLAAGGLAARDVRAGTTYRVTNLGYLVDPDMRSPFTRGWRVNAHGHVAGETVHPDSGVTPFLWTPADGTVSLGPQAQVFPPATWLAVDLNDMDAVVGYAHGIAMPGAFLWTRADGLRDLATVTGATEIRAVGGINPAGDIVGTLSEAGTIRPFVWREGAGLNILSPPFPVGSAAGINAAGEFIGTTGTSPGQAYRWHPQTGFALIGDLPDGLVSSSANDLNQAGHIVGASSAGVGGSRAFLWTAEGGMEDLGTLSDGAPFHYWALGINASDQIVGSGMGQYGDLQAFLWTREDGMRNLNAMIDPADPLFGKVELSHAVDINDSGQIIAHGKFIWSLAFLLTPVTADDSTPSATVPLPSWSLGVLALALLGVAQATRSRHRRPNA